MPEKEKRLDHVIVGCSSIEDIDNALAYNGESIQYLKVTSKAVPLRDDISEIVQICRNHGVAPYLGGGMTEDAIASGTIKQHVDFIHGLGIDTIEISNSKGVLDDAAYKNLIGSLRNDFQHLLVEVGSKHRRGPYDNYQRWVRDVEIALNQNVDEIVLEGAVSGRVGIYTESGKPKTLLAAYLFSLTEEYITRFIVEAPRWEQQMHWITMFGPEVKLGNIILGIFDIRERLQEMRKDICADTPVEFSCGFPEQIINFSRTTVDDLEAESALLANRFVHQPFFS